MLLRSHQFWNAATTVSARKRAENERAALLKELRQVDRLAVAYLRLSERLSR